MKKLEGWSVEISRKDGTTFLATGGSGVLPVVHPKQNRKYAVEQKKGLRLYGFKCKVVKVVYGEPEVVK